MQGLKEEKPAARSVYTKQNSDDIELFFFFLVRAENVVHWH